MKIYKRVNGKWYRNPGLDITTLEVPTRIKSYGDKQRENLSYAYYKEHRDNRVLHR